MDAQSQLGTLIGWAWIGSGFIGALLLIAKGKLHLGLIGWILFGWWGLLLAAAIGGGVLFLWGLMAKSPYHCPHCRKEVAREATICPYCRSTLTPIQRPTTDPASQLAQLEMLRSQTLISPGEYEKRRQEILAQQASAATSSN